MNNRNFKQFSTIYFKHSTFNDDLMILTSKCDYCITKYEEIKKK